MKSISIFSTWFPVIGWAGLIFYLSHVPNLNTGWGLWDFVFRKIAHVTEYAVLNLLLLRALNRSGRPSTRVQFFLIGSILSIVYAVSDEFHQLFVQGREGSVGDVIIDSCGVVVGALLYRHGRTLIHRIRGDQSNYETNSHPDEK